MSKFIAFWRNGSYQPEIYTDVVDATVDTQDTNLQTTHVFSGGTFDGVAVTAYEIGVGTMTNFLNDKTTKVVPGSVIGTPTRHGTAPVVPGTDRYVPNSKFRGNYQVGVCINGDENDDMPFEANITEIYGPTGAFGVTGLINGKPGDIRILFNTTAQVMTLLNNDEGSTAGNKIITGTGATVTVQGKCVALFYSGVQSAWIPFAYPTIDAP
jgi:hypothetical protein